MIADRKRAALQKLELARKKLEILRMLGGDPGSVARQAKQIAQEIAAAAREYGAALQAEGGADGADAANVAPEAPASSEATASRGSPPSAGAETADATDAAGGSAGTDTPAAATTAGMGPALAKDGVPDASVALTTKATDPAVERQKTAEAYQAVAAKMADRANKAKGEADDLAKFKDAAREAKELVKNAAHKLKAKHPDDLAVADAQRATAAMDREIQDLGARMEAQQGGSIAEGIASASAGSGTTDTASPAVNILA